MKIVFDTNVILDSALRRNDFEHCQKLISAVSEGKLEGAVTANTINDIHYIVRKRTDERTAREIINAILTIFDVIPVDRDVYFEALYSDINDFEDAVLTVCAVHSASDYIATGDIGFVNAAGSPVKAMRPGDILELL